MNKVDLLSSTFFILSIILIVIFYKFEISERVIDTDYEYIKKHRVFGTLTRYLSILCILSAVLLDLKLIIDKSNVLIPSYAAYWGIIALITVCIGFFQKKDSKYYKRSFISIILILIYILVCIYVFSSVLF